MTAAFRVEHRCRCGTLLGVQHEDALHLRYKQFFAAVCGRADVRCRRCERIVSLTTER
jgi:hypothetical protein